MKKEMRVKTANAKILMIHPPVYVLSMAIGIVLLVYMVTVEGEPGAIPLLLLLAGSTGFVIRRYLTQTKQ